jgi:hypothetical protein
VAGGCSGQVGVTTTAVLGVEQVPIDLLRPDPANPRRISEVELDAPERSIREFGFVQPVPARPEATTLPLYPPCRGSRPATGPSSVPRQCLAGC